MGRLKALQIKSLPPGNHSDGNNLYLRVKPTGARSWVFRFKQNGKVAELGLGSVAIRTLSEARNLAIDMCRLIAAGSNPKQALTPKQQEKTFSDYAGELIEAKKQGWRNAKHASQWVNTLAQYAYPVIGNKPVADIDINDLKKILKPIWGTKTETASRLRMRIEAVLDYGYLHEGTDKANPARWRGSLDKLLPSPKKTKSVEHFTAIPYEHLPSVMAQLRTRLSVAALCVRWVALTACRSGMARAMTWDEIDTEKRAWVISGTKMKTGVEFRVPLSDECVAILKQAERFKSFSQTGCVFPGERAGRPMGDTVLSSELKRASFPQATVHGLRSSFMDWAADETDFPREIREQALAHSIGVVERAYRRSDLFEKRRELMDAWANFLAK